MELLQALTCAQWHHFHGNLRYVCSHIPGVNSLIWNPPHCFPPGCTAQTATSDGIYYIKTPALKSPTQVTQMANNLMASFICFSFLALHSDRLILHFPEKWSDVNEHDSIGGERGTAWHFISFLKWIISERMRVWGLGGGGGGGGGGYWPSGPEHSRDRSRKNTHHCQTVFPRLSCDVVFTVFYHQHSSFPKIDTCAHQFWVLQLEELFLLLQLSYWTDSRPEELKSWVYHKKNPISKCWAKNTVILCFIGSIVGCSLLVGWLVCCWVV